MKQTGSNKICLPSKIMSEKHIVVRIPIKICVIAYTCQTKRRILKVGTLSFEGIIILLIYFLNCRKALFTKK